MIERDTYRALALAFAVGVLVGVGLDCRVRVGSPNTTSCQRACGERGMSRVTHSECVCSDPSR